MEKILIATQNPGKAREYRKIFEPKGFEVTTLLDLDAKLQRCWILMRIKFRRLMRMAIVLLKMH